MNLAYSGKIGQIYKIWISNLFLQIITLTIYSPWAKTKMRKYIYSNILIFGEGLEYSGTGKELLLGGFKALIVMISIPILIITLIVMAIMAATGSGIFQESPSTNLAVDVITYFLIIFVYFYAQFAALKYRLNRSRWKSIKGQIKGSASEFAFFKYKRMLINILTLGLFIGRSDLLARQYLIERISIGQTPLTFTGNYKALDIANIGSLLLALPTLMLSRLWYANKRRNYFWNSIKIGEYLQMSSTFGFRKILWLWFSNVLLIIFTLGLAIPFCLNRSVRYMIENIQINGDQEDAEFLQSDQNSSGTGDAMVDMIDSSSDFDIDFGIW